MTTLRFPDAAAWLRSGMLDITDGGRMGRPIAEIQVDGEPHRLVQLDVQGGEVVLTYECWTEAL